ncbi:hypothetical protein RXV94_09020 [Yeosuana sp. MJ-SS3]|uniref:DUF4382 domain-containing protein n=1 Tax=Gilvirhabdus luticola TaxID=3079858 RepID=A0ABU3U7B7_9FLAO|nr:hypothetical protein [Yeosuana sp. MJ-SS3]MDU8886300.1 hypothetical protein [Yeosuana sp. MJ-SS3]
MKSTLFFIKLCLLFLFLFNCKNDKKEQIKLHDTETEDVKQTEHYIEIVTNVMDFQSVDTIPSGWNTFKYINKSTQAHFFLLDKYPEGKTIQNTIAEVGPPFENGMEFIMQGDMDKAMAEFGKLPEWFGQIVFTGGSGLLSPKQTSITTVKLDPGLYIMECYVKMADGKFHTSMGMAKEIHVLDEDSGNTPPEADLDIRISSTQGINYEGTITKGKHTFAVHYEDQIVHENFVGHDVNLVKLEENADLKELEAWMNWATPTGLMDPVPDGVTFLGGTNDAPAGSTQYFEVDLSPGKYALISEVPNTSSKNMLKTFEVTD